VERHPNSARFHDLLREAGELHDKKQGDYGRGEDPFANVRASELWGIDGWIGAMVRLSDKVGRLQSLARKGYLNNEAAVDSFMDIAVYALIARVLYEEAVPETCAPVMCGETECCGGSCTILNDDASEWEAPGAGLLERARGYIEKSDEARLTGCHEGAMSVAGPTGAIDRNGDA
jgi:hypothetical protein